MDIRAMKDVIQNDYKVKYEGSGSINIDNRKYTPTSFQKFLKDREDQFLKTLKKDKEKRSQVYEFYTDDDGFPDNCQNLLNELSNDARAELKDKTIEVSSKQLFKADNYSFKNHILVRDIHNSEKLIFDLAQNKATLVSVDEFNEWKREIPKEQAQLINQQTVRGIIEYNPFSIYSISQGVFNGKEVNMVNAHIFPDWRKLKIANPKPPEEFKDFMTYLFPNQECRDYILDWMHYLLCDRNHTYLVLHGLAGTGKTTFANICKRLVGHENSAEVGKGFWESRFRGEINNKRFVYMDEHYIDDTNKNEMKKLVNDKIPMEKKGKDALPQVDNYNSYLISNNPDTGISLTSEDRKFSIPVITKVKMLDAFPVKFLEDLMDKIENDNEFIANIGFWVINRKPKYKVYEPYKSTLYHDIVINSLNEWQRKLRDYIMSGEDDKINIADLSHLLSLKITVGRQKVHNFLENHRESDGSRLGEVQQNKAERFIKVNPKYVLTEETTVDYIEEEDF
jgi:hypothetical protein